MTRREWCVKNRNERISKGICTQCPNLAELGKTRCRPCLEKSKLDAHKRYSTRLASNKCVRCGEVSTSSLCEPCKEARRTTDPQDITNRNNRNASIVYNYINGTSSLKIGEEVGLAPANVRNILKKNNIQCRLAWQDSRKFSLDENFFENINSEEKAYWLGFIATDGNVQRTRRRRTLNIDLQASDVDHLDKFAAAIKYQGNVKIRTCSNAMLNKRACLRIYSTKMADDLIKAGITPNKTFTVEPWNGPKELMRHYWRGCIDGDGSIFTSNSAWHVDLCGNHMMMSGFSLFLQSELNITSNINKHSSIFAIRHGGNAIVPKIINLLYKDATIFLDRKMDLARAACQTTL